MREDGFTLIEAIAVLMILGITLLIAISAISSPSIYSLKSQVDTIKAHLRFAQNRAMNTSIVYGINFSGGSYYFFSAENPQNPLLIPGEEEAIIRLPTGMSISPSGIVTFDSWGKPYTDAMGTTLQTDGRTFVVSYGGDSEVITITPRTGFIP